MPDVACEVTLPWEGVSSPRNSCTFLSSQKYYLQSKPHSLHSKMDQVADNYHEFGCTHSDSIFHVNYKPLKFCHGSVTNKDCNRLHCEVKLNGESADADRLISGSAMNGRCESWRFKTPVGRLELLNRIGMGQFSSVYRARYITCDSVHSVCAHEVAVKIVQVNRTFIFVTPMLSNNQRTFFPTGSTEEKYCLL